MQGMSASQPYAYMVPAGDSDDVKDSRDRQLSNVQDTVARGVLPGNMLVFGGPDSGKTADLLTTAFKDAKPGSFKGVIVLFIGDKADEQRVEDVLKPTNATIRAFAACPAHSTRCTFVGVFACRSPLMLFAASHNKRRPM
jgi:hypothetical protein